MRFTIIILSVMYAFSLTHGMDTNKQDTRQNNGFIHFFQDIKSFFTTIPSPFTKKAHRKNCCPALLPNPQKQAAILSSNLIKLNGNKDFLFGVSTSEHQSSTLCSTTTCSWSRFAQDHNLLQPTDILKFCLWNDYKKYIDTAAQLHMNALRFSVEWALIQPDGPGNWDIDALENYSQRIIYAIKKGITPIICLHHYTDPCWFIDRGGFENEQNCHYFVEYCDTLYTTVVEAIHNDVQALEALHAIKNRPPLFATFCSPEGYCFKGYLRLSAPPANPQKRGLGWVAKVLGNMLNAHTTVYYKLKNRWQSLELNPIIDTPQIGFLKNIHQLEASTNSLIHLSLSPLSKMICMLGNKIQHDLVMTFFRTGIFKLFIPWAVNVSIENPQAQGALDFIGLNYYSNRVMFLGVQQQETNSSLSTDNRDYRIHPDGLYNAIAEIDKKIASPLGIPIYVTENGIATTDHSKRNRFYQLYLHSLTRAVQDGYPVKGYLTWTLADNYEWPEPHEPYKYREYGLCQVDNNNFIPKKGSSYYLQLVKQFRK